MNWQSIQNQLLTWAPAWMWFIASVFLIIASLRLLLRNRGKNTVERPKDDFERIPFNRDDPDFSLRKWLEDEIAWYKQAVGRKEDEYNAKTPEVVEWLFGLVTATVLLSLGALALYATVSLPSTSIFFGLALNPQWVAYFAIGVYVLVGFRAIDTDKLAGLDFFGTPVWQFGNGLKWYPWLVFQLTIETGQLVQAEAPGDADHVFWDDEEKTLPEDMVRAVYVLSGENPDGTLPTDKQTNLGISWLVKFQLTKERFFDLVRNVAPIDPENGEMIRKTMTGNQAVSDRLLEVLRYLRDTGSAFAASILGKASYNEITTHRHLVDELLKLRIKLEIIPWGLELDEARFTQINPGHTYNKDLQIRAAAVTERDRLTTVADGKQADITKVGIATAAARLALLEAEAAGQKAIKDQLGVDGEVVIGAEVGKELAKGGNTVIAPNIAGLGAAFQSGGAAVNKGKDSTTSSNT